MRRIVLLTVLVVLLAACGSQPERVVLPTAAPTQPEPPTDGTPAPTPTTAQRTIPTLPPPRETVARTDARQAAVVSATGAIASDMIVPGEIYITNTRGALSRVTTEGGNRQPMWAADGNRLYYVSNQAGTEDIYTLNVTNTNPVQQLSPFPSGNEYDPALSGSGEQIAFTSDRTGTPNIFAMSAFDGRGVQQLTQGDGRNYQPDWAASNDWIAFTSERDGNPEIYIMTPAGEQVTRLTNNPAADTHPVFSPDASRLAFISDRDGSPQIYIMNLPTPRREFGEPPRSATVDLLSGNIPPLEIDTDNPNPVIIPITAGDTAPKSSVNWYITDEGIMRLTYTAVITDADGETRYQAYLSSDDNSDVQPLGGLQLSFTQPAMRPLPR